MSDLQLVTGLAIITSGFAQLRCGISAYHWQRVVQLAWFSSVTHMSCLTFLRRYFYNHKLAQLWRIPGIIALNVMVAIGLWPTAHYGWDLPHGTDDKPEPHDHAICYWNRHSSSGDKERSYTALKSRIVASAVLLNIGMLYRLLRLYQAPTAALSRFRSNISIRVKAVLQKLYSRCSVDHDSTWPGRLRHFLQHFETMLVYRPILALYLATRVMLDLYTSMAFDVSHRVHQFSRLY